MLENSEGKKPKEVLIPNEDWQKIKELTLKNINEKLAVAKELLELGTHDNISAGLYTFALEEYGKLLLLDNSKNIANNTKKKIKYSGEFTNHDRKFETALDYLQNYSKTSSKCYVLNNKGGFTHQGFTWRTFDIGLIVDLEARTSIFYSDFSYKSNEKGDRTDEITISEIPDIDRKYLKEAIDELSNIVNQTSNN